MQPSKWVEGRVAAGLANRIKAPLFVRWPHELKDGPPTWSAARARLAAE
jgi:hypothetical protein